MPQVLGGILGNVALALTANAGLAASAVAFQFATGLGVILGQSLIVGGAATARTTLGLDHVAGIIRK